MVLQAETLLPLCSAAAAAACRLLLTNASHCPACLNCRSMSLKSCRQTLEEDMGLEKGALKPYKALLSAQIDKVGLRLD